MQHVTACPQGKVRRIRTSPFHKGSGDSAPAATKPAAVKNAKKKAADTSEEEVLESQRQQMATRHQSPCSSVCIFYMPVLVQE